MSAYKNSTTRRAWERFVELADIVDDSRDKPNMFDDPDKAYGDAREEMSELWQEHDFTPLTEYELNYYL